MKKSQSLTRDLSPACPDRMPSLYHFCHHHFLGHRYLFIQTKSNILITIPTNLQLLSLHSGSIKSTLFLSAWFHFTPTTSQSRGRKKHQDDAGFKPGLPAHQASALVIAPLPLGLDISFFFFIARLYEQVLFVRFKKKSYISEESHENIFEAKKIESDAIFFHKKILTRFENDPNLNVGDD